ncbi:hypothetical protein KEM52_003257, partial [Ascosphaera acerosa]
LPLGAPNILPARGIGTAVLEVEMLGMFPAEDTSERLRRDIVEMMDDIVPLPIAPSRGVALGGAAVAVVGSPDLDSDPDVEPDPDPDPEPEPITVPASDDSSEDEIDVESDWAPV